MQTEIIKLNSLKASISALFQNLSNKCQSSKDYDITVIVKQSEVGTASSSNSDSANKKVNGVQFNVNPMILNQEISQSYISLDENIDTFKSLKTEKSLQQSKFPKMGTKIRFKKKQDKENADPTQELKVKISNYAQTDENIEKNLMTQFKIQDSCPNSQRFSYKLNNQKVDTQNSSDDSQNGDDADGGFLIQNYLNQAVQYIQHLQMQKLEDFLYKFKEKYSFINVRTQTKWSLLMGYCKESKLQFQRAATNYSQVINYILENPLMVTIQIADIYCRLGRCYFEIKQWNKAITAYSSSLNIYKKNKKCLEYSNCITNLGVLYLEIGYFMQAQRCFLMAFNIKRSEGDKKDKKIRMSLLQTYYHLFDCNLKLKNLLQCEQIIGNINTIIEQQQSHLNIIHKIRYYTKCAKLLFFQGKFEFCQNYYYHALNLFKKHNINNEEHAQALSLIGLLKHEVGDLEKSKFYYEKAYLLLQKYVPVDSSKLSVLKKNLQNINELLFSKNRENSKSKVTKNTMIIEDNKHFGEIKEKRRNQTAIIMRDIKSN